MSAASVLAKFAKLNVWERDGVRKPYKPLLVLYALGQWNNDKRSPVFFSDLEEPLTELMAEFGKANNPRPEYPFWYLQNDKIWQVKRTHPAKALVDRRCNFEGSPDSLERTPCPRANDRNGSHA